MPCDLRGENLRHFFRLLLGVQQEIGIVKSAACGFVQRRKRLQITHSRAAPMFSTRTRARGPSRATGCGVSQRVTLPARSRTSMRTKTCEAMFFGSGQRYEPLLVM